MPQPEPTIELGFASLVPVEGAEKKAPPIRFLVLKDGDMEWSGVNYTLDEESANAVIAEFKRHGTHLPIDYHHSTQHAEQEPGTVKAPAAGWIRGLEYVPDEGLYAVDVEWTDTAAAEIAAKEYKYISPALFVNKATGKPVTLHSVALLNRPRTRGLTELLEAATRAAFRSEDMTQTATKSKPKGTKLDAAQDDVEQPGLQITPEQTAIVKLKELLGLGDDVPLVDILKAAIDKLGGAGESEEEMEGASEVAAALGLDKGAKVDLVCATARELMAKAGQHETLAKRVKELETANAERVELDKATAAQLLVDEQIKAGKLLPDIGEDAMKAALRHAQTDADGFKAVYASMPIVCPPGQVVTASSEPGGRARVIASASKEYADNPQVGHGAKLEYYVNASLREAELSELTAGELKKLEGGD